MITPPINSVGMYVLKEPFNQYVVSNYQYRCISVKTIREAVISEIDFKETIYTAKGISEEDYAKDLSANINIVTIQNTIGDKVIVPSTFILQIPDINGVAYTNTILGINLGPVPDLLNLTSLKTKLSQVVNEYIGIQNVEVKEVVSGDSVVMSQADHAVLETIRQGRVSANETDYGKYITVKAERDAMAIRIAALENHIRVNNI